MVENLDGLSDEEKKKNLFIQQKKLLDTFLQKGAITQAQYDKSFGDLARKMGFSEQLEGLTSGNDDSNH